MHDVATCDRLQVDFYRALVAQQVQRDSRQLGVRSRPHDAAGVTALGLDDDDVGPLVRQDLRGEWSHHDAREVQYPEAIQRSFAHSPRIRAVGGLMQRVSLGDH